MKDKVFALIDCNNFFASCERVFRPDLAHKPVAVLSNNDGCIIARSNEVKALGIPMAAPHFKHTNTLKAHDVQLFSANFHLYGDFSERVTTVLQQFMPHIEVYSVDESFADLTSLPTDDYQGWAQNVVRAVYQQTGIPVSIGVAPSKTAAKAAAEYAKKHPEAKGAWAIFPDQPDYQATLEWLPIEDVWGVGRRLAPRLRQKNVQTAWDLTKVHDQWALEQLTVRGLRTVKELRGESQLALEESHEPQKSIAATRSFGQHIYSLGELEAAVASFAARAAAKLRQQEEVATVVHAFIQTGRNARVQRSVSSHQLLEVPSSSTPDILSASLEILKEIYDPDFGYKRAGVLLTQLLPKAAAQLSFLEQPTDSQLKRKDRLMHALDGVNRRFGKGTLQYAVQGAKKQQMWHARRKMMSPAYTTDWRMLPKVKS